MTFGALTLDDAGAVTAPTAFPLALPTAESKVWRGHGPASSIAYPGGRGFMLGNGSDDLRHTTGDGDEVYRTGLLAPYTAMTVAPSGAQGTVTLDLDDAGDGSSIYNPADGDKISLHSSVVIEFKTALTLGGSGSIEVLRGATGDITLDNLDYLVSGSGGSEGVHYQDASSGGGIAGLRTIWEVTSQPASYQLALRHKNYGDTQVVQLLVGTWTDCLLGSLDGDAGQPQYEVISGSAGSGTDPALGSYDYGYGLMRQGDLARSAISQIASADLGGSMNVALSDLLAPAEDDDVDHKFWTRTQSSGDKHFIAADIPEADTTDTDDVSNLELGKKQVYVPRYYRPYESGHIPRVAHLAEKDGIWFGAGVKRMASYDRGTVTATTGSKELTFAGAYPTKEMEHWTFRLDEGDEESADEYTIVWVDEPNQKAYIERDYEGAGGSSKGYLLRDTRDPFTIYRCEPLLPNQTGPTMSIGGVTSPDARGVTGLYAAFGGIVAFTGTGAWVLTGTPSSGFRLFHAHEGVGCAAGRSIVYVDGLLYWLGTDGAIYAWNGTGEPYKASSPRSQNGEVSGIGGTTNRINMAYAHNAFGHYDPVRRIIRWAVPLDSAVTNEDAIVLSLQTGTWATHTIPDLTYIQTVTDSSGGLRTLAGDIHGNVWEIDVEPVSGQGSSDGAYGFEPRFDVTSATVEVVTASGAAFPTSGVGLAGAPFLLVSPGGAFTRARVASNTSTALSLTRYLSAAPSSAFQGMCGAIFMDITSGNFSGGAPALLKTFEALVATFAKQPDGQFFMGFSNDDGTPCVNGGDCFTFTASDGKAHGWWQDEGTRGKFRIVCIEPGCDPSIDNLQLWMRLPERTPA